MKRGISRRIQQVEINRPLHRNRISRLAGAVGYRKNSKCGESMVVCASKEKRNLGAIKSTLRKRSERHVGRGRCVSHPNSTWTGNTLKKKMCIRKAQRTEIKNGIYLFNSINKVKQSKTTGRPNTKSGSQLQRTLRRIRQTSSSTWEKRFASKCNMLSFLIFKIDKSTDFWRSRSRKACIELRER